MFELLPNVQSVPVDQDSLTMIHRGMNKIRVSVSNHISEPSEVYIITGQSSGNLETYIIFYLLEPGIHIVYGCEMNPYAPDQKDQVIEEAVIFVEEMGSILEEIPWESMTTDQRSDWIEKEILYAQPVIEDLEEVEEIETLEVAPVEDEVSEEAVLEAEIAIDPADDVVEVSEDEVEQALSEDGSDETLQVSREVDESPMDVDDKSEDMEDFEEDEVGGVDGADMEDVVVADGDFDELLKQAFLKPDVAEKTKFKKSKKDIWKFREEQSVPETAAEEEDEEVTAKEETEWPEAIESVELEKELEIPGEPESTFKPVRGLSPDDKTVDVAEVSPRANHRVLSEQDNRLMVIRFLSRF